MPNRQLSYLSLPPLSVAINDATPNPGKRGDMVYSTVELRPMVWTGASWQLAGHSETNFLVGVTNSANWLYATGGEAGIATGFGVATLLLLKARDFCGLTSKGTLGANGWVQFIDTQFRYTFALSGVATAPLYSFTNGELGKIYLLVGLYDSTGARVRSYVARDQLSTGTAAGSYNVATGNHYIGNLNHASYPPTKSPILAHLTFRGIPTDEQIRALYDTTRLLGDLPGSVPGATIAHRWSVKDTLATRVFTHGQIAPNAFFDTVTNAAADTQTQIGVTSTLSKINNNEAPVYGIGGFNQGGYLRTDTNKGLIGNGTGFWGALLWQPDYITSTNQTFVAHATSVSTTQFTQGWVLRTGSSNSLLLTMIQNSIATANSSFTYIVAADLNIPEVLVWNYDGTTFKLYRKNAIVADIAVTNFVPASDAQTWFGNAPLTTRGQPLLSTLFAAMGGNVALTAGQVSLIFSEFDKYDYMFPLAGVTANYWDFNRDITDSAGVSRAVPSLILDRIGDAHLFPSIGGWAVFQGGLKGNEPARPDGAATAYCASKINAFAGSTAGFYIECLYEELDLIEKATEYLVCQTNAALTEGYILQVYASGLLDIFILRTGGFTRITTPPSPLIGLHHIVAVMTGTQLALYIDGVQQGSPVSVSGTYIPHTTGVLTAGSRRTASSSGLLSSRVLYGVSAGDSIPTPAEITTAAANALATKVVAGFPAGKTSRLWSMREDILENNSTLPGYFRERISNAANLAVVGSPLQPVVRARKKWSYDNEPINYGFICPATAGDVFAATAVKIGNLENVPFWITTVLRMDAAAIVSPHYLYSKFNNAPPYSGFATSLSSSGITSVLGHVSGASTAWANTPTKSIAAGEIGKIVIFTLTYNPVTNLATTFYNKMQVSSGIGLSGSYIPDTGPLAWGGLRTNGGGQSNLNTLIGLCGGNYSVSAGDILRQHTDIMDADDIVPIFQKTNHAWSMRDMASVTTFIKGVTAVPDRIGTANMVMTNYTANSITKTPIYVRNFAI
jgi:hypothetical protein